MATMAKPPLQDLGSALERLWADICANVPDALRPKSIKTDGSACRFSTNGKRTDDAGELHAWWDGGCLHGWWKDFRTEVYRTFCSRDSRDLTPEQRTAQAERIKASREVAEREQAQRRAAAAAEAEAIWEASADAPADHPYLAKKRVKAHGLKVRSGHKIIRGVQCDGALIVPLRDGGGRLSTLQFITADAEKRFLYGGETRGSFHLLGTIEADSVIIIAEGFATAASLHEATGHPVIAAMDKGNLLTIAKTFRARYPEARMVIAGDNDRDGDKDGGGEAAARAAAVAVDAAVAMPPPDAGKADWNDVGIACGGGALKVGVRMALRLKAEQGNAPAPPPPPPTPPALPTAQVISTREMVERYVHITAGNMVLDLKNPRSIESFKDFAAAHRHCKTTVGKHVYYHAEQWAESERIQVNRLTFDPAHGRFFADDDGLRAFNLWDPPQWPAGPVEVIAPILAHIEYLFPEVESRGLFLDWVAQAVQEPHRRPHFHFLHITAATGTGRGFLGDLFTRMWTSRHCENNADIYDLLNPHDQFRTSALSGKVMVVCPEVKAPPDERFALKERMRSFFSQASIRVNEKGMKRWTERACFRLFMATNNEDALPIGETDRRVVPVFGPTAEKPKAYYGRLYALLDDPKVLGAFWCWLKARNLTASRTDGRPAFDLAYRPPLDAAKRSVIAASRSDEQRSVIELVEACPFDVMWSPDIMETAAPLDMREVPDGEGSTKDVPAETTMQRTARCRPLEAVLKETGRSTYVKKIKVGGQMSRAWILRNPDKWKDAPIAKIREEADRARHDLIMVAYNLADITEKWEAVSAGYGYKSPKDAEDAADPAAKSSYGKSKNGDDMTASTASTSSQDLSNTTASTASTASYKGFEDDQSGEWRV